MNTIKIVNTVAILALFFHLNFKSKTKPNKAGIKIKVKIVERIKPPKITAPSPRYNSEPAPGITTKGNKPATDVNMLNRIGLTLLCTPIEMATR